MASNLESERAAIAECERTLAQRRQKLAASEAERAMAVNMLKRAGLFKIDLERLEALTTRIGVLGIEEVERRLR